VLVAKLTRNLLAGEFQERLQGMMLITGNVCDGLVHLQDSKYRREMGG
jgi:hypothetical protein